MPSARKESSPLGLVAARLLGPLVTFTAVCLLVYAYRQEPTPTPWLIGSFVVGLVATPFFILGIQRRSFWILFGCLTWLQFAGYFVNYHFYSGVGLRGMMWVERVQQLSAKGLPILAAISLFNIFWLDWFLGSKDPGSEDSAD